METNHDPWDIGESERVSIEDTIVLVGLLLFQSSLFKSGYSREVVAELQIRLTEMVKRYSKKGL